MRYIPHTESETQEMLSSCKLSHIDDLFRSIPTQLKLNRELNIPPALSEQRLIRHFDKLGAKNLPVGQALSFLGAGCYQHHTPAAVSAIISRSEWVTPYTPYQPEISQGTLKAIFEYQTMICELTDMEVSNASHYDGATATAEAALMAIHKTKRNTIIAAGTLHPEYRDTIETILKPRNQHLIQIPFNEDGGINLQALKDAVTEETAGVIVQSPNFFGVIEKLDEVEAITHEKKAFFIVAVPEPTSLGLLKGPGSFGADIVTAEGQAFGGGLNYGGPNLGIFTSRQKYLRAMPGRIVGETTDTDGKRGYVLTMSTREQHIRREKATSNICSNEALLATNAAIYLSLMGKGGLRQLAEINLSNSEYLKSELAKVDGVTLAFGGPTFNEFVIKVNKDTDKLCGALVKEKIFAGVPLECWYPELNNHLLVCTTECHDKDDIDHFVNLLKKTL